MVTGVRMNRPASKACWMMDSMSGISNGFRM